MIVSASRRTDIPALYTPWLLGRLRAGYALVRNPMNHGMVRRVDLTPEAVDCLVFWTKNAENLARRLGEIEAMGYRFVFQYTVTPYGADLEPGLRDKRKIVRSFYSLSERFGPDRVLWRYDPVICNGALTESWHREQFEALCSAFEGYTRICTVSFVDLYPRLRRLAEAGTVREIRADEMRLLAAFFRQAAEARGISVRACCEKTDLTSVGVRPAACIDGELIARIFGLKDMPPQDKNQRPGCGCAASVDIGAYNTCSHGCVYCYANRSAASAHRNAALHDPKAEFLA